MTGFKHTFYSDLCSNDPTNFSRKDIIPTLWFISSGSRCFSSCLYVLIFPSLSCAAAVPLQFPCPRGMPRLPAGKIQQSLGFLLAFEADSPKIDLASPLKQCQSELLQLQEADTEQPRHSAERSWLPSVKNSSFCTLSAMLFISAGD